METYPQTFSPEFLSIVSTIPEKKIMLTTFKKLTFCKGFMEKMTDHQ